MPCSEFVIRVLQLNSLQLDYQTYPQFRILEQIQYLLHKK